MWMTFKTEKERIVINRVVDRNFCRESQWTSGNQNCCTVIIKKKRWNGEKKKKIMEFQEKLMKMIAKTDYFSHVFPLLIYYVRL